MRGAGLCLPNWIDTQHGSRPSCTLTRTSRSWRLACRGRVYTADPFPVILDTIRVRREIGCTEPIPFDEAVRQSVGWEPHPHDEVEPARSDDSAEDPCARRLRQHVAGYPPRGHLSPKAPPPLPLAATTAE